MTSLYKPWIPKDLAEHMPRSPRRRPSGVARPRPLPGGREGGTDRGAAPVPRVEPGRPRIVATPARQAGSPSLGPVRDLLSRAAEASERMVEQARGLAGGIQEKARADGYQAGLQEGLNEGRADADRIRETAFDLVRQAREIRESAAESARDDLVQVAMALARQIMRREAYLEPDTIADMVDQALEVLPRGTEVLVRAHPSSIVVLRQQRGKTVSTGDGAYHLTYMADEDMEPGDFVFDTVYGQLDGRIETQLARLAEEVRHHIADGGEVRDGGEEA